MPNDPTDFDFACSLLAVFSLDDDADGTLSNTKTFNNVIPGAYTCTEANEPGWTTSISCVDPDGGTTTAPPTANIDLDGGEHVICTFTNTFTPGPPAVGGVLGLLDDSTSAPYSESRSSTTPATVPAIVLATLIGIAGVFIARRRSLG